MRVVLACLFVCSYVCRAGGLEVFDTLSRLLDSVFIYLTSCKGFTDIFIFFLSFCLPAVSFLFVFPVEMIIL